LSNDRFLSIKKNHIRQKILQKRNSLSLAQIQEKSRVIQARFIKLVEYSTAKSLGAYYPIGSEVRTQDIIYDALENKKTVGLPKLDVSSREEFEFYQILDSCMKLGNLTTGIFGTKEPQSNTILNQIDLIIVPGIVFDRTGFRLGYGKGLYDKFLAKNLSHFSIGLAFEIQVVDKELPRTTFDQRLNALVTEKRTMHF
jgi:5-formyltetrahydrofolate cyclo-ligase